MFWDENAPRWRLDRYFPIWLFLPWNNLGCLGFKLGFGLYSFLYIDFACWPSFGGIYMNVRGTRYRSHIKSFWKWRKIR